MVKRFFRFSIGSIILQLFVVLFIGVSLYVGILLSRAIIIRFTQGKCEIIEIFIALVFYFGVFLFGYVELTFLIGNICLYKDKISVRGDIKTGREKLQYRVSVKYKDIKKIEIVSLRKNSKNQTVPLSRPIPYLILIDDKGRKYRFGLYFMSKKAVKSLLEELLKKCIENNSVQFNVEDLLLDFKKARWATK